MQKPQLKEEKLSKPVRQRKKKEIESIKNPNDLEVSSATKKIQSIALTQIKEVLDELSQQVIRDSDQLRRYITNKLVQISNCGVAKEELRALELLGKVSDVGLFVEKSEITVTHTNSEALEDSIRERIARLLAQKQEIETIEDAEYEEVSAENIENSEYRED